MLRCLCHYSSFTLCYPDLSCLSSERTECRPRALSTSLSLPLCAGRSLTDDGNYAAILSWNSDFAARPPLVIQPASTADVAAAINFLRSHSLPFTVGGGLHSRFSTRDGHVLLSLCLMRTVTVDKALRLVRAQGGALNDDVDRACATVHMHCPMGTYPSTGIGGLVPGGGLGFLSCRLGLSLDCLQEVELVTADGRVLRVNEREQVELFWAVRGAGYDFGVITEFVLTSTPSAISSAASFWRTTLSLASTLCQPGTAGTHDRTRRPTVPSVTVRQDFARAAVAVRGAGSGRSVRRSRFVHRRTAGQFAARSRSNCHLCIPGCRVPCLCGTRSTDRSTRPTHTASLRRSPRRHVPLTTERLRTVPNARSPPRSCMHSAGVQQ